MKFFSVHDGQDACRSPQSIRNYPQLTVRSTLSIPYHASKRGRYSQRRIEKAQTSWGKIYCDCSKCLSLYTLRQCCSSPWAVHAAIWVHIVNSRTSSLFEGIISGSHLPTQITFKCTGYVWFSSLFRSIRRLLCLGGWKRNKELEKS